MKIIIAKLVIPRHLAALIKVAHQCQRHDAGAAAPRPCTTRRQQKPQAVGKDGGDRRQRIDAEARDDDRFAPQRVRQRPASSSPSPMPPTNAVSTSCARLTSRGKFGRDLRAAPAASESMERRRPRKVGPASR